MKVTLSTICSPDQCLTVISYYKIIVDGKEVLRAGEYINNGSKKHIFNLQPHTMTDRDTEWLEAHNERRQKW